MISLCLDLIIMEEMRYNGDHSYTERYRTFGHPVIRNVRDVFFETLEITGILDEFDIE